MEVAKYSDVAQIRKYQQHPLLFPFFCVCVKNLVIHQGEHFREVMKRIQTMLDIQEKEFEKVMTTWQ